jgi:hypothetical protein
VYVCVCIHTHTYIIEDVTTVQILLAIFLPEKAKYCLTYCCLSSCMVSCLPHTSGIQTVFCVTLWFCGQVFRGSASTFPLE